MIAPPKLKIGSPATGVHFFPRAPLRGRLLRALDRDHVAFVGPRRTGKTSLLRDLQDNPPAGTSALYLDLQGLNSVPAWLNLMLVETKKVLSTPPDKLQWLKLAGGKIGGVVKRLEEISILGSGIKITEGKPAAESWQPVADQFLALLKEHRLPIYFMLDEFPWFLGHVADHHTAAEVDAALNWFRAARLELSGQPTRFLVTGSIGLKGLLRRHGLSTTANDFDTIEIDPLSPNEALRFLSERADGEGLTLSTVAARRILHCLGVGWPILLATFLSEIQEHGFASGPTVRDIDRLYEDRLVRGSRNKYCDEMFNRLTKPEFFSLSERQLAQVILHALCRSDQGFGRAEFDERHAIQVPDAAHRVTLVSELNYVVDTLRHDGYLLRAKDKDPAKDGRHCFSSHMLRDYWRHHTT